MADWDIGRKVSKRVGIFTVAIFHGKMADGSYCGSVWAWYQPDIFAHTKHWRLKAGYERGELEQFFNSVRAEDLGYVDVATLSSLLSSGNGVRL